MTHLSDQDIRAREIRDEAWKEFARREKYGYTDIESARAFDGGWDAALSCSVIRRVRVEALRDAAMCGAFGTSAQSTLLARADRIEKGDIS